MNSFLLIIVIFIIAIFIYSNIKINKNNISINLERIKKECNTVYTDIDLSENKYKEKLELEKDYFTKGLYSTALVQIYIVQNDYDKVNRYYKIAYENYNKVKNGDVYKVALDKCLAWGMLRMYKYSEALNIVNNLIESIDSTMRFKLTEEEIRDTEAMVYTILLSIYTDFDIVKKAKIYYDKLSEIEMTPELELYRGDKIYFSKMLYAYKINDPSLMRKYTNKCYEIALKRDKESGTRTAESVILNIAIANIREGKDENTLDMIKIAENFYIDIKDYISLSDVYTIYAQYYEGVDNIKLAAQYYLKAIDNYNKHKNYFKLNGNIEEYIYFLERNNLQNNIEEYYKIYYKLSDKVDSDEKLNELLTEIVSTNETLSNNKLSYLQEQTKKSKTVALATATIVVILSIVVFKFGILLKKKNQIEKKLKEISRKDYLTGVNTREYGYSLVLDLIKEKKKFSIGILDIDNFKSINDTYGHVFGDVVLKTLANRLERDLGDEDIIIRYGGEEFIIIFLNKDSREAKAKLDRARERFNKLVFENNVTVSFSAGIKDSDDGEVDNILEEADKLLYSAKKQGKNRVFI